MRTLETFVDFEMGKLKLGELRDITNSIPQMPLNQLIPYISGREDLEVVMKHPQLINSRLIEFNGLKTKSILSKASKIESTAFNINQSYSNLVNNSPSLMSFPSEVTWLSVEDGIEKFKENVIWILQKDYFNFDESKAKKIADHYAELIKSNYQNYSMWNGLNVRLEGEHLYSLLIEISIELALQARMKFLAGFTPVINQKTASSIELSDKINWAYNKILTDRENYGHNSLKYFYTLNLNSSVIQPDSYSDELKRIVSLTGRAMQEPEFDGIFLSVRGLENISKSRGRVSTLLKLIEELSFIAHEERVPIWLSRFGLAGYAAFDSGVNYSSYTLNMGLRDVFTSGFGNGERASHGKVFHWPSRKILNVSQAEKVIAYEGFPEFHGIRNTPTTAQLQSSTLYRTNFSKPTNVAAMCTLEEIWTAETRSGEINAGKEYIKTFSEPSFYNTWGCD